MRKIILTLLILILIAPVAAIDCDYKYVPSVLPYNGYAEHPIQANKGAVINITSDGSFLSFPKNVYFNNTTSMSARINITIPAGTGIKFYSEHLFLKSDTGTKDNVTFCFNITSEEKDMTDQELIDELLRRMKKGTLVTEVNKTIYSPVVLSEGVTDWIANCSPSHINQYNLRILECQNTSNYLKSQNENFTKELNTTRIMYENKLEEMDRKTSPNTYFIPLGIICLGLTGIILLQKYGNGRFWV